MTTPLQPIYLFADSQLLFWRNNGTLFLDSITHSLAEPATARAAYLGASNGDAPEFYNLFESAMAGIGIADCRRILSSCSAAEKSFIEQADIIMLAGGDVEKGWNAFQSAGLPELLVQRYRAGAIMMGVSAGAVQLGFTGWKSGELSRESLFDVLQLVPFTIGAHEEKTGWETLKKVVSLQGDFARGIGIPMGGGMIYHPDQTVEPIRHPLHEFFKTSLQMSQGLLFPKE